MIVVVPPSIKLNVPVVVPSIVPAQASVVVGTVNAPSQSTVTPDRVGITGSVTSLIITSWVCVLVFPLPSS